MGSILGPTMAAFAMNMIESKFDNYEGQLPITYPRFVDDCFALFTSRDDAVNFLDFLNSHCTSLQFTIEFEADKTLHFLDTKINHKSSVVEVEWCFKNTNTGIYIPSCSYAPTKYKTAAMRALFLRAKRICSDHLYDKTVDKIVSVFRKNGFSENVILKIKSQVEHRLLSPKEIDESKLVYWKLPYFRENESAFNQKIKSLNKLLNGVKIKPVYLTLKTSNIFKNKDPIPPGLASNVVYEYKCDRCTERYIGETRRHLDTRIREHIYGRPTPSEVALHIHPPKKDNFRIIVRTPYPRLAETVWIVDLSNRGYNLMNERDSSVPLHLKL